MSREIDGGTSRTAVASSSRSANKSIIRGQRNLFLLGVLCVLIALATTGIELFIYRSSGDIYLDRSRPGFLPDEDEVAAESSSEQKSTYAYPATGSLDASELKEFITELETIETSLRSIADPYGPTPLADDALGITTSAATDSPDTSPASTKAE